jgi:hypothetical protein
MAAAPNESQLPSRAKRASNPSGYIELFPSNSDYVRPKKNPPGAKITRVPHHPGWLTKDPPQPGCRPLQRAKTHTGRRKMAGRQI